MQVKSDSRRVELGWGRLGSSERCSCSWAVLGAAYLAVFTITTTLLYTVYTPQPLLASARARPLQRNAPAWLLLTSVSLAGHYCHPEWGCWLNWCNWTGWIQPVCCFILANSANVRLMITLPTPHRGAKFTRHPSGLKFVQLAQRLDGGWRLPDVPPAACAAASGKKEQQCGGLFTLKETKHQLWTVNLSFDNLLQLCNFFFNKQHWKSLI